MRIPRRHLPLMLALYWSCAAVFAAEGDSRPVSLPIVDGYDVWFTRPGAESTPSHTRVTRVVQDDRGFIWLGTPHGLRRYDGIHFKLYRPEPWNPNSLRGANVEALFKGRDGHLWIASDDFLDRFDPVAEKFTHYRSEPGGIEGQVYHINEDRAGQMWLATDYGLVKLDPVTGTTIRYGHRPSDGTTLSSNFVRFTLEARDGSFWIATTSGLDVFDRQAGRVIRRVPLDISVRNALMTLLEDHRGVVWVSYSSGDGLANVDRVTYGVTYYSTHEREPDPSQLSGVEDILEDHDGALWFGTRGNGLLKLDKDRTQLTRYRNRPDDSTSLSENYIYCLFADRDGGIWAGTSGGGANRFSIRPMPFRAYRHNISNPQSLADDEVLSVLEDRRGVLWVGTKGVLNRIVRGARGKPDHYTFYSAGDPRLGLASTVVVSMAEDRSGYLWFGTFGGGLNRFDPKTGRFKVYRHVPSDPRSLADDVVTALFVSRNGALWAGSDSAISRFDPKSDRFDVHRIPSQPVSQFHGIGEDADGKLWLATWKAGLQRFDPTTGEFTSYGYDPAQTGLSSHWVNTVMVDRSGTIWAGTQAGLNRLDPRTGAFTVFGEREGLSNDTVTGILEDGNGNLWLSTNNGLNKFDPRTRSARDFYRSDGISANEFNRYGTSFKSATGEMFFASYGGLTAFFPDQIPERGIPGLVLTDFQVNGRPVPIGPESPLSQSISYVRSITLDHTQDMLSIEFAALAFAGQEGIRFRYRLRDVDAEWLQTDSTRPFVSYANLSPGRYVFQVQVTNVPGVWQAERELEIRVLPPWWSTWWFRASVVVAVVAILWIVHQRRVQQLAEQFNRTLEARVEKSRLFQELQQREAKVRRLIDANIVGVLISNLEGQILEANDALLNMVGYSRADLISGRARWTDWIPPEWRAVSERAVEQIREHGKCDLFEKEYLRKDGSRIPVLVAAAAIEGTKGEYVAFVLDLSERRRAEDARSRAEAELQQARNALAHRQRVSLLGEVAASLAHEIRAPIAAATVDAHICLRALGDDRLNLQSAREAASRMAKDATWADEIIARTSALYRKDPTQRERVDVNAVIRHMALLLQQEAAASSVSIRTALADGLPEVIADRVQLQQVCMNLMLNAIEAMKGTGGDLTIASEMREPGELLISVSDHGVGLPVDNPGTLFDAFVTTKPQGTGMGLAITRSIVEAHGGRVWASANTGPGATFFFTLLADAAEEPPSPSL
jgi:PAS domain S-box-containing protein